MKKLLSTALCAIILLSTTVFVNDTKVYANMSVQQKIDETKGYDDFYKGKFSDKYFITEDSTLWRYYSDGSKNKAYKVEKVMADVKFVHSLLGRTNYAIKNDGTLWAWGENSVGQVGNGTTTQVEAPVKVLDDVSYITGDLTAYAIKDDGTLWAWGNNNMGQVGNGTRDDVLSPKMILSNVSSFTDDYGTFMPQAITTDGSLYVWGAIYSRQKDGLKLTPTKMLDNVKETYDHYALKNDGSLCTWGTSTTQILTDVAMFYNANGTYYALKNDGTVWSWGINGGEIGNGTTSDEPIANPVKILDNVVYIGDAKALKSDGTLWAWGYNWDGEVGVGAKPDVIPTPVKILDNVKFFGSLYALKNDGTLWYWGKIYQHFNNDTILEGKYLPTKVLDNVAYVTSNNISLECNIVQYDHTYWASADYWNMGSYEPLKVADGMPLYGGKKPTINQSKFTFTDWKRDYTNGASAYYNLYNETGNTDKIYMAILNEGGNVYYYEGNDYVIGDCYELHFLDDVTLKPYEMLVNGRIFTQTSKFIVDGTFKITIIKFDSAKERDDFRKTVPIFTEGNYKDFDYIITDGDWLKKTFNVDLEPEIRMPKGDK